jgi:hypothetical protein
MVINMPQNTPLLGSIVKITSTSSLLNGVVGYVTGRVHDNFLGDWLYEVSFYYESPQTGDTIRSHCDMMEHELIALDMETGDYVL